MNKRSLYVSALDCKDVFGLVSHQLLEINLGKLRVPTRLKNLIMNSCNDSKSEFGVQVQIKDLLILRKVLNRDVL
jgi:uncharacterized protein YfeS